MMSSKTLLRYMLASDKEQLKATILERLAEHRWRIGVTSDSFGVSHDTLMRLIAAVGITETVNQHNKYRAAKMRKGGSSDV